MPDDGALTRKAFRGIPLGATERDVASTLKRDAAIACLDIEEQRACIHHTSLGDLKVIEIYPFDEDRLVQVFLSFKSPQYSLPREPMTVVQNFNVALREAAPDE